MLEYYKLNDGNTIPVIGYGTWRIDNVKGQKVIEDAIEVGYRLFDTASLYGSERMIGSAVNSSGLPREDFFLSSKVWLDEMGYKSTIKACYGTLKRLGTDYLDMYLIHWPRKVGMSDKEWKQLDIETWKALEFLVNEGKVKSIGVSNFLPHHLNNLLNNCNIIPAVNQLELHAGYFQEATVRFCEDKNIQVMAWGPLGRGKKTTDDVVPMVEIVGEKYKKSPQQIYLRYLIQRSIIPLPRSNSKSHMISNLDIFNFELSDQDMWILTCMPQNNWLGEHPDFSIPTKKTPTNQ